MRRAAIAVLIVAACSEPPLPLVRGSLGPDEGFSVHVPPPAQCKTREAKRCYFLKAPDINEGRDFFVSRITVNATPGSQQVSVFRVRTVKALRPESGTPISLGPNDSYQGTLVDGGDDVTSPCWTASNWSDWPLLASASGSYADWQLPDNVGLKLSPGEWLMIQTHASENSCDATLSLDLARYPSDVTPIEMGSIFATKQSIRICRSTTGRSRYTGACNLPGGPSVAAVSGHYHARGRRFSVYRWDGMDYAPPDSSDLIAELDGSIPMLKTGLDVKIPEGGGVRFTCEFEWEPPVNATCAEVDAKDPENAGDCCYTFGGSDAIGEHCNLSMYYYPRLENTDIFCN